MFSVFSILTVISIITLFYIIISKKNYLKTKYIIKNSKHNSANDKLKLANKKLSETNKTLSESIKELKKAKLKAEESDQLKSEFFANMSHEIRTPMNAILGFSNLLLENNLSKQNKNKFVRFIIENGKSLLNLIDDIIDISRIQAEKPKISLTQCNINDLLNGLYLYYTDTAIRNNKSDVKIKLSLPSSKDNGYEYMLTDPYRLKQILANLINNAIKFTYEGIIEFGYQKKNGNIIEFFVRDTGIGIANDNLHFVFKRSSQVNEYYNDGSNGSGLGLSISKQLIELLGGSIWVDSEEGTGSTFYFTLPSKRSKLNKYPEEEVNNDYYEKFNWSDKVILIAEDEKTNYIYLRSILEKTKAKIYWAENGLDVIDLCNRKKVNLILMDIRMPVMNGYEATLRIKSKYPDMPIIAQTAYVIPEDIDNIIDAGCSDYLVKPIKSEDVLALIDKYFQKIENSAV